MNRHRRFQLSMQAYFCTRMSGVGAIDPFFSEKRSVDDVVAHWDSIAREYRVMAQWRRPFRV